MRKIPFAKLVASGNDFLLLDCRRTRPFGGDYRSLARDICERRFGIGADGLLALERSSKADLRMRIFNADGSEAEMCGNGARCTAFYSGRTALTMETKAGIIHACRHGREVRVRFTDPKQARFDVPLRLGRKGLRLDSVNTGVPHAVIFVSGLDGIDVSGIGRRIRYHRHFAPAGTNVNFVEVVGGRSIRVRTYERGVEAETLACGTGSVASALVFAWRSGTDGPVAVQTKSKETLRVSFRREGDSFSDVWLQGKAYVVCQGHYYHL